MVRALVLTIVYAAISLGSLRADALATPSAATTRKASLQPGIFATRFRSTSPDSIVSYRWIEAGKAFETTIELPTVRLVTQWTIQSDGSLSGEGASGEQSGYIDSAGLPVVRGVSKGQPYESRLEPNGNGYVVVIVQDQAPPGEPPQWKEVKQTALLPVTKPEADQIVSQWAKGRSTVTSPGTSLRAAVASDDAAIRRHIAAIAAGQPLYQEMTASMAEAIRHDAEKYRKDFHDVLGPIVFSRYVGADGEGMGIFKAEHAYRGVTWKIAFGADGRLAGFWYESQPKRNEFREKPGKHGFDDPTVDDLPINAKISAFLEPSDGKTSGKTNGNVWRTDCYRIRAPAGSKLKFSAWTGGAQTFARLVEGCDDYERQSFAENDITTTDFGLRFVMPAPEAYVVVHGEATSRPYQVTLTELTPQEVAQWDEDIRQLNMAQQRIEAEKANTPSTFEAMVRGAAIGLSGIDAPLMPNEGSTLDVLNAAGAELARKNAIGQAQLDATIAQAQGQSKLGGVGAVPPPANRTTGAVGNALTKKSVRVYFEVPTNPQPDDDHNTICQSNIFNVTIDWDPSLEASGGNLKYANPVLDAMKADFIGRCLQAGRQATTINDAVWYSDAFGGWTAPRPSRKGDVEVVMP